MKRIFLLNYIFSLTEVLKFNFMERKMKKLIMLAPLFLGACSIFGGGDDAYDSSYNASSSTSSNNAVVSSSESSASKTTIMKKNNSGCTGSALFCATDEGEAFIK